MTFHCELSSTCRPYLNPDPSTSSTRELFKTILRYRLQQPKVSIGEPYKFSSERLQRVFMIF